MCFRDVWKKSYEFAKEHQLSEKEYEWLEKAQADGYGFLEQRLLDEAEEWESKGKDGRTISKRDRVHKILKSIDKASNIIGISIQHSPEITLVSPIIL